MKLWDKNIPLLVRRVGRDSGGVVAHKPSYGVNDHPVCSAKVGFAESFLMPQPPLLTRRGMRAAANKHFIGEL